MPYILDGEVDETFYGSSPDKFRVDRIGWLDDEHAFPRGIAEPEFPDKLRAFLPLVAKATRGFQQCLLCEDHPMGVPIEVNGKPFRMGSAEIVVASKDGKLFSAPNLIYHYVTEHGYLPPADFRAAVLDPGKLPEQIEASLRSM